MPSFDHTLELERSLLRILTTSRVHLRTYGHRAKEYMFTSPERRFVFEVIGGIGTSGVVTRKLFEYEVDSKIDDSDRSYFIGEWNIIENADASEHPEALIEKLEKAHAGREISKLGDDVDDLLEQGEIEEALARLKRGAVSIGGVSHQKPISELSDINRRLKTIEDKIANPGKYIGLQTGFERFDNITGGLFPGELTLIAGITGTGKSTLVRQIQKGVVTHPRNQGKNVLHIANEEYMEQVEHKFDAVFTEIPYLDFKRADISDENLERWKEYMQNWQSGRVFIKEVPAFTDVTLAEQAFRELEARGIPIHLITIDHLPNVKPIQKYFDQNDERAKAAADCKELGRWLRIPVLIPTQAATEVEKKQKRGQRGDKLDVYGSKAQVHVANTFMLITVNGTFDENGKEEWEQDVRWTCDIKKNRDGPPFWFRARHYVQIGKIEEVEGEGGKGTVKDESEAEGQIKADSATGGGASADVVEEIEEAATHYDEAKKVVKGGSYIERIRARKNHQKKH